jgi:hypothetical protein
MENLEIYRKEYCELLLDIFQDASYIVTNETFTEEEVLGYRDEIIKELMKSDMDAEEMEERIITIGKNREYFVYKIVSLIKELAESKVKEDKNRRITV